MKINDVSKFSCSGVMAKTVNFLIFDLESESH